MLTNGSRGTVLFAIGELHRMRSAKYKLDDRGPIDGTFELIGFEMGIGRNKGEIVKGIIEEGNPIDLGFIMQVIEGMKFNSKTVHRLVDKGIEEGLNLVANDKVETIKPLNKDGANAVTVEPAKRKKYAKIERQRQGKDLYAVRITCGACGSEHNRLTSADNRYVKCRDCEQKLIVERTMPELFEADGQGIAFQANAPYYTPRERYEFQQQLGADRDV